MGLVRRFLSCFSNIVVSRYSWGVGCKEYILTTLNLPRWIAAGDSRFYKYNACCCIEVNDNYISYILIKAYF